MMIGVAFADAVDGSIQCRMAACPSAGLRGDGVAVKDLVRDALRERPLRIGGRRLATGLAGTGGDGAVAAGGPAARHPSTRAADLLWQDAHPALALH